MILINSPQYEQGNSYRIKRSYSEPSLDCSHQGFAHIFKFQSTFQYDCDDFLHQKFNLNTPSTISFHSEVQNIVKCIHTITNWTVMLTDFENFRGYAFHHFEGFIFILLEDTLDQYEIQHFNTFMNNISLPKARVLVIVLGITTNVQNISNFLDYFSLLGAAVLLQNFHEKMQILTWTSDECGNFKEFTFHAPCSKVLQMPDTFEKVQDSKTYRDCTLHAIGLHDPPFSARNTREAESVVELMLLRYVASKFNFSIEHHLDITNSLSAKSIVYSGRDVSLNFPIPSSLFVQRYYTQTYTWFVQRVKNQPHWSNVTRVFRLDTWACVLFSLIIVSVLLKSLDIFNREDTVKCFLITWAVFLNVAVKKLPSNVRLRFLFFSWAIMSIAFTTVFQSFMTSFFIDPGKGHQIDTVEELEKSDLILSIGLKDNSVSCWQVMLERISDFLIFSNECSVMNYSVTNSSIAFLMSEEVFLYNFRSLGMLNRTSYFHKFSNGVINVYRFITMDMTSPFLPQLNIVIKHLVEAGIVEKLVDNSVDPSGLWKKIRSEHSILEEYVPLSLFHLSSSFIYLCFGFTLSFLVFVTEIAVRFYVNH
ncbi:hypothetical protein L9F63_027550 [Diploptera punctata]|uniref:Uncharacterized protein n=1 Tax=Diploptera punctata TaxID=6984 RepID=A0AAD8A834_DIPPU|nr:hypothetical protein L9F63_024123 [Diploptera punctata]KAJ9593806.1 hypothetical protein L9F63_027550 [Diploptera punctata]